MQAFCFAAATCTHPGSPPMAWTATDESRAEKTAVLPGAYQHLHLGVPLRARPLYRLDGEIILGFDHYCFWLGTPIGLKNRKFFMAYLLWSTLLCAFQRTVLIYDAEGLMPQLEVAAGGGRGDGTGGGALAIVFEMLTGRGAGREGLAAGANTSAAGGTQQPTNLMMLFAISQAGSVSDLWSGPSAEMRRHALAITNLELVTFRYCIYGECFNQITTSLMEILGVFWVYNAVLILRNRTSCFPKGEAAYDLGWRRNWTQVMGRQWWLWALPMWLSDAPEGTDGLDWPKLPSDVLSAV